MSVQLIVYPQNYNGQYSVVSSNSTEVLVNGVNFTGVSTANLYTSTANNPSLDTITNSPASTLNTWYRFTGSQGAQPNPPVETSGDLTLFSNGVSTAICGVYQQLSNLTIGQNYNINLKLDATVSGYIVFQVYDGTSVVGSGITLTNSLNITQQFTATSTNNVVMFYYVELTPSVSFSVTINNASVVTSGSAQLFDGQVILDLYEDETIPLTLSIDEFKNVAEKVQSYSKAFNLPATKRNNQIFDNIFEVTRSDDGVVFNPYKKTQCLLKQEGFILFEGYLRLIDVKDKEGEISYNVNLYSEVVALADVLKEKKFLDIDFNELEHDYNYTEIRNSWQGILGLTNPLPVGSYAGVSGSSTTNVLKYPFIDWEHQYTLDGNNFPVLDSLESSFRPFIKIKYLIDRIFHDTPFTYQSAYFNSAGFNNLFMDFNWGSERAPVSFSSGASGDWDDYQTIDNAWTTILFPINTFANMPELPYSAGVFTATFDNQYYSISSQMIFDWWSSANSTLNVEWVLTDGSTGAETILNPSGNIVNNNVSYTYQTSIWGYMQSGDTLHCRAKETGSTVVLEDDAFQFMYINTSLSQTANETLIETLRGDIGQWDFLKGLMTMFNLVSMPDKENPNNIIIEPYSDIFINNTIGTTLKDRSIQHDWTDKIDVAEMDLKPLTDLNKKTIFKFEEDEEDYAFKNYKNSLSGFLYGSKEFDASGFTVLEGEDEIEAKPFAATLVKPLMAQFSDFITPAIYSYNADDGTSKGFENKPRIMYDNGVQTLSSCTYFVPSQNGVSGDAFEDEFLQFSHLTTIPTTTGTIDINFGACQLIPPVGVPVPDNLFNLYWLPYYAELYNPDTRTMTIKVDLKPSDINTFKFNDTILLKNRQFRVNKIDYKPNDLSKVEFILIP